MFRYFITNEVGVLIQVLMFKQRIMKIKLNNSFGKYLLLSIGEIFLIVVGILLALQLDNWDKEHENREFEQQYYVNIHDQLIEDKNEIQGNLNYSKKYMLEYKQAIRIIAENDKNRNSDLAKIALNLKYFSDFKRKSSIFQTLVNSGEIKHIRNKKLIQRLQNLESSYVYINRLEDVHKELILNQLIPYVVKAVQIQPLEIKNTELLYNYYFHNILILTIELMEETEQLYQSTIDEIDTILASSPLSNAPHD